MTTLPAFSTYGNYSSDNYGAHAMKIDMGIFELYYSYQTIVAFYDPQFGGIVCSENVWSNTTAKHLKVIQPDKKKRVKNSEFNLLLEKMLKERINI